MEPIKQKQQFFTPLWLAKSCVQKVHTMFSPELDKLFWIDPSAGEGAFYQQLPVERRVGIEIDKQYQSKGYVYKEPNGFLSVSDDDLGIIAQVPTCHRVVIGNPPFAQRQTAILQDGHTNAVGGRINLALQFICHGCQIADTVALILGKNARRPSFQKKIPEGFRLILDEDLPDVNFTFPESSSSSSSERTTISTTTKHIHTVFHIYQRIRFTLYVGVTAKNPLLVHEASKSMIVPAKKTMNPYTHNNHGNLIMSSAIKICQGQWMDGDWEIVFPTDPRCNIMIKRWATNRIGYVTTDKHEIEQEMNKARAKEQSFLEKAGNYGKIKKTTSSCVRKRLGRTDATYFFLHSNVPHIVARRFESKRHLFLKLKQMATTNSFSCNQQQLLDIYLS